LQHEQRGRDLQHVHDNGMTVGKGDVHDDALVLPVDDLDGVIAWHVQNGRHLQHVQNERHLQHEQRGRDLQHVHDNGMTVGKGDVHDDALVLPVDDQDGVIAWHVQRDDDKCVGVPEPHTDAHFALRDELESIIKERDACIQEVERARDDAETAYLVLQSVRAEGQRLREGIRVRRGALEALVSECESLQREFKSWSESESESLMRANMPSDDTMQTADRDAHGTCAKCHQASHSVGGIHTKEERTSQQTFNGETKSHTGEQKMMPTCVLDDSNEYSDGGVSVDLGAYDMGERTICSVLNSVEVSMMESESCRTADSIMSVREKKDFAEHIAR
jgi:hypothetical protein